MTQLLYTLLKYATLPFAIIYGIIIYLRNKFYDWGIFSSIQFSVPVISIGNLTVGGTGKSPHIEYLVELLKNEFQVATLSRGYKRRTRGFRIASLESDAYDIGDEPFQFKAKYPQICVAVAEERMTAIPSLMQREPHTQVILLDDAFQHRTVKPHWSILLTDYDRLYTRDFIMPFGLLRESRSAAKRANTIIVSKCNPGMTKDEMDLIKKELKPQSYQHVFFTSIVYKAIYPLTLFEKSYNKDTLVILVTAIANPKPLISHLEKQFQSIHHLSYSDHHYFNREDIEEMKEAYDFAKTENKIFLTTEKDAARLMLLKDKINEYQLPFYCQPIGIEFLNNESYIFNNEIIDLLRPFYPIIVEEESSDEEKR
ncbi:MAG: tetraacyldisaccharide 4'-kinase [Chitinophagaceae bacterium]